jgi:signal transduction histidine kinase
MIIINDILDLCRLDGNVMPLERTAIPLLKTVEESLEVVAFESEKKGLDVICQIDPLLPEIVVGDATRIRQVLINLLGNAVKFSNSGDIVVSISGTNRTASNVWDIQFSVQDHGIYIPSSI